MTAHDDYRHMLGAYVLGGLTPTDRAAVDTHITTCPTCRAELADFAVIPSLLARTAAPEPDSSSGLDARVLRAVAGSRGSQRRRRRSAAAVLAAAALAIGIGVGATLAPEPVTPAPAPVAAQRVLPLTAPVGTPTGSVDLTSKPWGTELHLTLHDLPAGMRLTAIVIGTDGHTESAATWTTPDQSQIKVTGASSFRPETVQRIEIRSDTGASLATG
ncbi:zf-HC2 domain-containing protein [Nocardia yamanashiensis]|uniref:anti-sigma factor family protein n=1 Tax=Nocardia yamanashiensis TaxID=209247 RepID=UPI001E4C59B8|nr:zf-HC2 domain-containing protein [Nocardia yamanashiensis]UGT40667.1 zf-HC2 domain-containing protein [Nocardia yamanashiensis]